MQDTRYSGCKNLIYSIFKSSTWFNKPKSENIISHSQLTDIKDNLTKNVEDIVNDSLSKVEGAVIEGLKTENVKLHRNVESLDSRISKLETNCNKEDGIKAGKI